jgi:acyl-CoA thioester hydrolase
MRPWVSLMPDALPLLKTRVRYGETDQMSYAYHAHAAVWFDQARTELLRQMGYPYRQMEVEGWILPVLELKVQYLKAAHYDDELSLFAELKSFSDPGKRPSRLRFRIEYIVRRDDEICYRGETSHCFQKEDGGQRKLVPIPAWLQNHLGELHD